MSRPKRAAATVDMTHVVNLMCIGIYHIAAEFSATATDIDIADILGHKYRIDISKCDINPPLVCTAWCTALI